MFVNIEIIMYNFMRWRNNDMVKTPEQLREIFWKKDLLNGGVIRNQYEQIKHIIKNKDFQFAKEQLNAIKKHAIENTEFYSKYTMESNFPVMNKMIFLENKSTCKAKRGFDLPLHVSSTSGSTGTPFSVEQDYKKRMRVIAELKVFGEFGNYESHERMIFYRVLTKKIKRTAKQEDEENIYYIDCSDLSKNGLEKMKKALWDINPKVVLGYSSTILLLAKYLKATSVDIVNGFNLQSIILGGEGIFEKDRTLIESVFKCKVYRRYSDMELGILGQDDGNGGAYNLNWASYYFECLKLDKDEPADSGEIGRIVITDLFNYSFPMIRYDTGDLGIIEYFDDRLPILKEIYGRKNDCVFSTDGRIISQFKLINEMWGIENIKQWQFIQKRKNLYILKLNCSEKINEKYFIDKFKNILGYDADIKIEYVDEIPVLASTKRRTVICEYNKK